jgi:hypothetical protein
LGRAQLADTGAVELPELVALEGVAAVVADAEKLATRAHHPDGVDSAPPLLPEPTLPGCYPLPAEALTFRNTPLDA